ncbi:MAG: hypothetical protein JWM10_3921 [Myxococcaceae bacterium]|nr:hypothetical protein [Myxococcaceae bacterium]
MRDETIDCRPHPFMRALGWIGPLVYGPMAAFPWFDRPVFPPEMAVLCTAMFAVMAALSPVLFLRPFVRVDAAGLVWRSAFGCTHAAPWSSVAGLRTRGQANPTLQDFIADLDDSRSVRWSPQWTNAAQLRERVLRCLDRTSYRMHGGFEEAPVRVSFPAWPRRIEAAFAFAFAAGGLLFFGWCGVMLVEMIRRGGDVGPVLYMLALFVLPMASFALSAATVMWRQRHAHSRDVLVIDPRGLSVTGGEVELRASWNDVTAVTPLPSLSPSALRVVTMAGAFVVPYDALGLVRSQLRTRLPPSVREAWERPDGDDAARATTPPDGSRRHGFEVLGSVAPWLLDAVAATLICFWTLTTLAMRPDDQPITLPAAHFATLATLCALFVLLHRGARALLGVTVSPTGCAWSGPWRRRRFAWSEVAAVGFPAYPYARLSLRLSDGTRLWCFPSLLAGGNALVATFREHLAGVPRSETP